VRADGILRTRPRVAGPQPKNRYDRPSYSVAKGSTVVQVDPYGNKLYAKPQLLIRGGRVYAADAYGTKQQKFAIESEPKK
jgi:hypothetical protein